jgi:poly(3-hydroxybutyrate) depolymerase
LTAFARRVKTRPVPNHRALATACVIFSASTLGTARAAHAVVRSTGCNVSAPRTGDFHLTTTDGNGTSRDYEVVVPSPLPTGTLALTFVFHGAGATEADAKKFGLQTAPGAATASIFVFPQGIPYLGDGVGWNDSCGGYDMPFFDKMLASLEAGYCIDEDRVFVAGFSWGCDFVTALTCCRGTRVRAAAAASCTDDFTNSANYSSYINLPCPAAGHAGVRFTFDPQGDTGYTAQDFQSTNSLFRSFASCTGTSSATSVPACVSYAGCRSPYLECTYPGLGHNLPANWPGDTWAFFTSVASGSIQAATTPAIGSRLPVLAAALLLSGLVAGAERSRRRHTR